jgi:endonuclease III
MDDIDRVIAHLKELGVVPPLASSEPYNHMGAVIVDAVLQAGLNYKNVVEKRVTAVAAIEAARTTEGFAQLLASRGVETLLSGWRPGRKTRLVQSLTDLLIREDVNTVAEFMDWLQRPDNLSKLSALHGIGPKTVDYLKDLVGIPSVAVDKHLDTFLTNAGIARRSYLEARTLIEGVADRMGVDRSALDHSVWKFMSEGRYS